MEELVFVAMRAVRTLQAAEEEDSHTNRCENGEGIVTDFDPLNQINHRSQPKRAFPAHRRSTTIAA